MVIALVDDLILGSWLTRDHLKKLWHLDAHDFICTWSIRELIHAIDIGQRILIEAKLLRVTEGRQLGQHKFKVRMNVLDF